MITANVLYALALQKLAAEKEKSKGSGAAAAAAGAALGSLVGSTAGTVSGHIVGRDILRREVHATKQMIEGKIKDFQGMSLGKKLKFLFRTKKK